MVDSLTSTTDRTPKAKTPWSTLILLGMLALVLVLALWPGKNVMGPEGMFRSNRGIAEMQMANLAYALRHYRDDVGQLPGTLEALTVAAPPEGEPWLSAVPRDPWGQPYEYRIDGDRFTLRSFGEDEQPDTEDDIRWPRP